MKWLPILLVAICGCTVSVSVKRCPTNTGGNLTYVQPGTGETHPRQFLPQMPTGPPPAHAMSFQHNSIETVTITRQQYDSMLTAQQLLEKLHHSHPATK